MIEKFKDSAIDGDINVRMDEVKGYWVADKRTVLAQIQSICKQYKNQGYSLTLRQLYYQLVSKDYIPNHDKVYAKLSKLKDDAVYGGLVDWKVFEDRGRLPNVPYSEDGVSEALERTVDFYRLERQKGQEIHVEVWTEKDAISSILKRITNKMGVTLVVNKGYTSSTAIYGSYCRFVEKINEGKKVVVLYFGDHDPSGLDMVRDINDRIIYMITRGDRLSWDRVDKWWSSEGLTVHDMMRLEGFEKVEKLLYQDGTDKLEALWERGQRQMYLDWNDSFTVKQIGLTMEQIRLYNPPPNPAKITDPRAKSYIKEFGQVSWEVDALTPTVMEDIVEGAIEDTIDMDVYNSVLTEEENDKNTIKKMVEDLNDEE